MSMLARALATGAGLLIGATTMSFVPSNEWWIRVLDFPRLQIAVALSVVLAACLVLVNRGRWRAMLGDRANASYRLDVTEDPTPGAQQLSFFNGFYGGWCYLPLVVFLTFDEEPQQYLVAAVLRPGTAPASVGVAGVLRRLIPKLWAAFPQARLRVRMDGGFAPPALFDELEAADVEYLVAMAKNRVLEAAAAPLLVEARAAALATRTSARVYGDTQYQAGTWAHPRRAVIKAEVVVHPGRSLRDNPRIVITNLRHAPERLYAELYCARGDSENRLKELHHGLALGRTSCSRFWANQLHVLLTAAAYVLLPASVAPNVSSSNRDVSPTRSTPDS